MTTATEAAVRPKQTESTQQIITTPEMEEDKFVRGVVKATRQVRPYFTHQQARPVTAATPIPPSIELDAVKAERLGGIEPPLTGADILHAGKIVGGGITGKSSWWRSALGEGFRKIFRKRVRGKASVEKITPIDIGE